MKKTVKTVISLLTALCLTAAMFIPVFAEEVKAKDLQKSIVYIKHEVVQVPRHLASKYSYKTSWTGTGFAVGKVGEPVQYIASADHVVVPGSVVREFAFDGRGNYIGSREVDVQLTAAVEDNLPIRGKNGKYNTFVDICDEQTLSLVAYYSTATDDFVTLSVIQKNHEHDVALCKIASDPTDKIVARPLRSYTDVEVGEDVIAIGYPGTSEGSNTEGYNKEYVSGRHDYSDSTVTKGIVSKIQLTKGVNDSSTQYYTYLVDAQTAGGNSGGPLFDAEGNILGLCSYSHHDQDQVVKSNYFAVIDEITYLMDASKLEYTQVVKDKNPETETTDVIIDEPEPTPDRTLIICLSAAALVLVIALIAILVVRGKKKDESAQITAADGATTPLADGVPADVGATMPEPSKPKKYLIGVKGYFAGKKFSIEDRAVIGRDATRCNVVFPADQPGVSSIHCEIIVSGDSLLIKDCDSTYGTFFADGNKLTPNMPIALRSGAQFWVGDENNVFEVKY